MRLSFDGPVCLDRAENQLVSACDSPLAAALRARRELRAYRRRTGSAGHVAPRDRARRLEPVQHVIPEQRMRLERCERQTRRARSLRARSRESVTDRGVCFAERRSFSTR